MSQEGLPYRPRTASDGQVRCAAPARPAGGDHLHAPATRVGSSLLARDGGLVGVGGAFPPLLCAASMTHPPPHSIQRTATVPEKVALVALLALLPLTYVTSGFDAWLVMAAGTAAVPVVVAFTRHWATFAGGCDRFLRSCYPTLVTVATFTAAGRWSSSPCSPVWLRPTAGLGCRCRRVFRLCGYTPCPSHIHCFRSDRRYQSVARRGRLPASLRPSSPHDVNTGSVLLPGTLARVCRARPCGPDTLPRRLLRSLTPLEVADPAQSQSGNCR